MTGAAGPLLEIDSLTRRFGGLTAVDGVTFSVAPGEIVALIGPNGAGKTTLFNLITGLLTPSSGAVRYGGRRLTGLPPERIAALGIVRTFQNLVVFGEMSVAENVMVGCHRWTRAGLLQAAFSLPAARREDQLARETAMDALGLVGLRQHARNPARNLTVGQQRFLELARAVAARPSVLLLDEPAAGLTAAEAQRLLDVIRRLRAGGAAVLVIEHNMDVVMEAADRVVVLDYGEKIAEGPPQTVQRDPRVVAAYLGEDVAPAAGGSAP